MKLLCLLHFHHYGSWYRIQEVPIWKRGSWGDGLCVTVGSQPVKEQLYSSPNGRGTVKHFEPDITFRLVGKVVEQRRTCIREGCHYTQVQFKKWTV